MPGEELIDPKLALKRRDFLSIAGWGALFTSLGVFAIANLKYSFPNVLYEPPTKFKIGNPSDFPENSVTFLEEKKLFVLRESGKFHVISAVCTHLGCTVRLMLANKDFECPCHGSKFKMSGEVFSGPAPAPLNWYELSIAKDGKLVVDMGKIVGRNSSLSI